MNAGDDLIGTRQLGLPPRPALGLRAAGPFESATSSICPPLSVSRALSHEMGMVGHNLSVFFKRSLWPLCRELVTGARGDQEDGDSEMTARVPARNDGGWDQAVSSENGASPTLSPLLRLLQLQLPR